MNSIVCGVCVCVCGGNTCLVCDAMLCVLSNLAVNHIAGEY